MSIVVSPFFGSTEVALISRFKPGNAFSEEALEFGGAFEGIILHAALCQAHADDWQIGKRAGRQAGQVAHVAQGTPGQANKFGFIPRSPGTGGLE
jgi:hypothetical protein